MKKVYLLIAILIAAFSAGAQTTASCTASFEFRDSIVYSPFTHYVKFKANPHSDPNKIVKKVCWNFGDGTESCTELTVGTASSTLLTTIHKYPATTTPLATYNVCLTIVYDGGCEAHKCISIQLQSPTVSNICSADFRTEIGTGTNSQTAHFIASPFHSNNKKPVYICWDFGDGSTLSCQQYASTYTGTYSTSHTYARPGTYEVCERIVYDGGCESRKCKTVTIPAPAPPTTCSVDLRTETTASNSLRNYFIATPSHSGNKKPVLVCWTFGDGSAQVCQQYAATYTGTYVTSHNYLNAGNYEVCVRILYDGGCETKKCKVVTVPPPTTCSANIRFEPVLSSTIGRRFFVVPENNAGKKPVLVCWKFGNSTQEICKQYAATYTGTYSIDYNFPNYGENEVCVRILYEGGCEAKKCVTVKLEKPCEASVFEAASNIENLERKFYVSVMNDRVVEKICWNFGDGTDQHCYSAPNPGSQDALIATHKYPGPGTYKLCVRIQYAGGCVVEKCREVVIKPRQGDTPCGGYMTTRTEERTVAFRGVSLSATANAAADFTWSFGDGSTGTGPEVKHSYAAAGTYLVCLTIKTADCETKICKRIVVGGNTQPQLILSPNPVVNNLHIRFFSTRAETVTIRIFSANGIVLRTFTRTAVVGANEWNIADVASLSTGVYSVVVQSSFQFANAIFFKQ